MTDVEGPIDDVTGTRRIWLDMEDPSTLSPDDQVGYATSSRYLSDNGAGCADLSVYPVALDDGDFDVCAMWTIGRTSSDKDGPRPDDSADIQYEYPFTMSFETVEDAQRAARKYGREDMSYCLYLRFIP